MFNQDTTKELSKLYLKTHSINTKLKVLDFEQELFVNDEYRDWETCFPVTIGGGISRKRQSEEQRRLNQLQMEREDNAVQRHVADLQAAGLNKQVAAGGQGAASSPIQAPNDAGMSESVMEQAALATKAITESIEETKSNAALAEAEALLAEQRAEAQRIQNELNIARTNSIGVGDQYTAARTAGEQQRQEHEKTAEQRRAEIHAMIIDRDARLS